MTDERRTGDTEAGILFSDGRDFRLPVALLFGRAGAILLVVNSLPDIMGDAALQQRMDIGLAIIVAIGGFVCGATVGALLSGLIGRPGRNGWLMAAVTVAATPVIAGFLYGSIFPVIGNVVGAIFGAILTVNIWTNPVSALIALLLLVDVHVAVLRRRAPQGAFT